jgi:hypothetical protein
VWAGVIRDGVNSGEPREWSEILVLGCPLAAGSDNDAFAAWVEDLPGIGADCGNNPARPR